LVKNIYYLFKYKKGINSLGTHTNFYAYDNSDCLAFHPRDAIFCSRMCLASYAMTISLRPYLLGGVEDSTMDRVTLFGSEHGYRSSARIIQPF